MAGTEGLLVGLEGFAAGIRVMRRRQPGDSPEASGWFVAGIRVVHRTQVSGRFWHGSRRLVVGIGMVRGRPRGGPTGAHGAGRRLAPLAEACNHGGQTQGRGQRRAGQSFPRHSQPRAPNEQELRDPLTGFSCRWRTGTVAPCPGLFACAGGFPCAGVLPCPGGFLGSVVPCGER